MNSSPLGKPKIIGLAGFAGSGKDTAADAIDGRGWKKMAFADALKEAARAIFRFTEHQLHNPQGKTTPDPFWGCTPRWALQRLGTEAVRRGIGEDTWTKALFRRAEEFWENSPWVGVVIPDVRFLNEAQAIKERGGLLVLIDRPGITGDGHESELLPLEKGIFDVVICNSDSVDALQAMMLKVAGI